MGREDDGAAGLLALDDAPDVALAYGIHAGGLVQEDEEVRR